MVFFQIEKVELETDRCVAEVSNLFAKVDDRRQKRDVPDFLCGKISFEILKEPVITPSGKTILQNNYVYFKKNRISVSGYS
jgi:STIP1 family protein 1